MRVILLLPVSIVIGCVSSQSRYEYAATIANENSLNYSQSRSNQFLLTTYAKINPSSEYLHVYIEGDGFAWKRKNILSTNPTPKEPTGLKLASQDNGDSILYLARPCQYLSNIQLENCLSKYWSSHRYSEEVITAMNNVIQQFTIKFNIKSIRLIGYSGGGSVAVLIAARRNDVANITTIAANLDHVKWTDLHNITPLTGSLNAADYAEKTKNISQLHLVGEKDKIVPRSIIDSYKSKSSNPGKITIKTILDYNHECCWVKNWVKLNEENNKYIDQDSSN